MEVRQVAGEGAEASAVRRLENLISNGIETRELLLRRDAVYEVTFHHLSSTEDAPDYDYSFGVSLNIEKGEWDEPFVIDAEGLLGNHSDDGSFRDKKLTLVCPRVRVMTDYNRDGAFDETDEALAEAGEPIRMWINDDADKGDCAEDVKGGNADGARVGGNYADDCVNGRNDLHDWFPVLFDFGALAPFATTGDYTLRLSGEGSALNVIWTDYGVDTFGAFYQSDARFVGVPASSSPHAAKAMTFDGTVEVPRSLLLLSRLREGKIVAFVEGKTAWSGAIAVTLRDGAGEAIARVGQSPTFSVSSVRDMFTVVDLRNCLERGYLHVKALEDAEKAMASEPANNPRRDDYADVFFLHGFNVDEAGAEAWFSEMFKRLWRSGARMNFYGVSWRGDEGGAMHYHENVDNAFLTVPFLKRILGTKPRRRVLIAHSLGNMLASSAIVEEGLAADDYFMLNAAVPNEAYDPSAIQAENGVATQAETDGVEDELPATLANPTTRALIHEDWHAYPRRTFAAEWYKLWPEENGENRNALHWSGLFSDIFTQCTCHNYSSSEDEVLMLCERTPRPLRDGETWGHFAWHKQEIYKGRGRFLNVSERIAGTQVMGWGFNETTYEPSDARFFDDNWQTFLKTNVVFRLNANDYNSLIDQPAGHKLSKPLIHQYLAMGIPALSPPAGALAEATPVWRDRWTDLKTLREGKGTWGRFTAPFPNRWLHSDVKNMAYFYVKALFDELAKKINGEYNEDVER